MKRAIIDISLHDMPVAKRIRESLDHLSIQRKKEVFEQMSESEFIEYRVSIFLDELERALLSDAYTSAGADEVAYRECLSDLQN